MGNGTSSQVVARALALQSGQTRRVQGGGACPSACGLCPLRCLHRGPGGMRRVPQQPRLASSAVGIARASVLTSSGGQPPSRPAQTRSRCAPPPTWLLRAASAPARLAVRFQRGFPERGRQGGDTNRHVSFTMLSNSMG